MPPISNSVGSNDICERTAHMFSAKRACVVMSLVGSLCRLASICRFFCFFVISEFEFFLVQLFFLQIVGLFHFEKITEKGNVLALFNCKQYSFLGFSFRFSIMTSLIGRLEHYNENIGQSLSKIAEDGYVLVVSKLFKTST